MPEAMTSKPFAVGVNHCHHRLLGKREPYRHIFIQIKNGRVSSICLLYVIIVLKMANKKKVIASKVSNLMISYQR